MKFIFFGGKESLFAQIILDGLINAGWEPAAAIRDAKSPIDADYLRSLRADFFLIAAFGKILKKEVIEIPPKGVIGVHPSLLPRLRGPSPIQSTLLNDEKETGTTLFLIDEKVDHGPILASVKCQVSSEDNYKSLLKKLAEISIPLLLETIPKWLNGAIKPQIQDEAQETYTKKIEIEDARIDLTKDSPQKIWLKIRALNPEPGTFTLLELKNGRYLRVKLLAADFKDGKLKLKTVQPEGKKIMGFQDFLNGYQHQLIKPASLFF